MARDDAGDHIKAGLALASNGEHEEAVRRFDEAILDSYAYRADLG